MLFRSRVLPASTPTPMQNNFLPPDEGKSIALAPPAESMDISTNTLDYDSKRFGFISMASEARSGGHAICFSINPSASSTSWSRDVLHRSFNFCMQPTVFISEPCYWASKQQDKIPAYECLEIASVFCLGPLGIVNSLCSLSLLMVSAPIVYGVDRIASACHVPLKPYSQEFNAKVELAIDAKNLPLLIKLTEKKINRDFILIDHCTLIMRLTGEEFSQPITMKQRVQLYSHMADRLRLYREKSKYKINGPNDFFVKLTHFIKVLLFSGTSFKRLVMLDCVLKIEGRTVTKGFKDELSYYFNEILWDNLVNKNKTRKPAWKNYSVKENNMKDLKPFYKILCVLNNHHLLNEELRKILRQLDLTFGALEHRLAFFSGSKSENRESALNQSFFNNPIYEKKLVGMIFEMSGFARGNVPMLRESKAEDPSNDELEASQLSVVRI